MEAQYTWLSIGNGNGNVSSKSVIEIMAAPICDPSVFLGEICDKMKSGCTLCIGGELKSSGEGKPASNFRYEKDLEINGKVIDNYYQLFNLHRDVFHSKPIFVTTIPRRWRKYSWFIQEDGMMVRWHHEYRKRVDEPISYHGFPSGEDSMDTNDDELMNFLSEFDVKQEQLIKIRECCKGARYNTYLADMISFLYQLRCNDDDFSSTFYPEFRKLEVVNDGTIDQMVFNETMGKGFVFLCPKETSVDSIYRDFMEAISLRENEMKAKIRKHLLENTIHRWTDFSANDTDDAFTILMLIHAFNGIIDLDGIVSNYKPSEEENIILDGLSKSLEHWFSQLH